MAEVVISDGKLEPSLDKQIKRLEEEIKTKEKGLLNNPMPNTLYASAAGLAELTLEEMKSELKELEEMKKNHGNEGVQK